MAAHPDAVWNTLEPKTGEQRENIIARGHALVGTTYDYPAYIAFALMCLHLRNGKQLDPVFTHDHWRACSADVADEYAFGGINVMNNAAAWLAQQYILAGGTGVVPNLVTPADLYNRIASANWGHE